MEFKDIERSVVAARACLHPLLIRESIGAQIPDDRGESRAQFHPESIRITVLHPSVSAIDHIFIHLAGLCVLLENLIKLRTHRLFHLFFFPVVELADDADLIRHGSIRAEYNPAILRMSSHVFICIKHISVKKFLKVHLSPLVKSAHISKQNSHEFYHDQSSLPE